jgi:hypothetical protein
VERNSLPTGLGSTSREAIREPGAENVPFGVCFPSSGTKAMERGFCSLRRRMNIEWNVISG